ncbi:MAG: PQQ-binding-like beta-propeller repeat protein [Armatimonadota bacterium]
MRAFPRPLRLTAALGLLSAGICAAQAAPGVAEQSWPQWRGPLASGVTATATPPITWSEESNVKWKVKLPGSGTSTPIIWGDRIFVQTAVPASGKVADAETGGGGGAPRSIQPTEPYRFTLLCLDRATGKTLWERVAKEEIPHEGHHPDHGFSSHSPVTDGEHVWSFFGSRGLHCYSLDGQHKWSKDLGRMRTRNGFGEGSSPALHGDTLVVNWDHEGDDFIAALDKKTGEERWRQPRDESTSWSTPLIVEHGGRTQVVTAATNRIRSYDLETGKLVWECAGLTANTIPTPVTADGVVYAMSGFRGNALLAIRLGREGDLTGTDAIVWSHNKSTPYVPSPLLYHDRLYFLSNNAGILSCFDAKTGKPLIDAERIPELIGVYASPLGADGRVYLLGRNGAAVVIKDGEKLEVLARNKLDDRFDASPVAVGKELFLRGHQSLYCIAEK